MGHPGAQLRHVFRAGLVLAIRAGTSIRQVAAEHTRTRATVAKWAGRVAAAAVAGLLDTPRSGRPVLYLDEAVRELVTVATSTRTGPCALWTHRALPNAMWEKNWGVTCSWVTAKLKDLGLKVHRVQGWIHRRADPDFEARVAAVHRVVTEARVGDRPVLSVDEKTAHPVRTPVRGDSRAGDGTVRREFEYVHRGTVSWYGVQDCATGAVQMIRAIEQMDSVAFIEVLQSLVAVHGSEFVVVMDNGPAHTSKATRAWLEQHLGIEVVFTPKHASWVNPIESVFGILARQVLKYGWLKDVLECDQAVQD